VITPIGAVGQTDNTYSPLDICERVLLKLPVTTTRWRLRIRNYNSLTNTAKTTATSLTMTGAYVGTPSFPTGGGDRWTGIFTATPAQALASASMPLDGSEWTSGWVTAANQQFAAGVAQGLSVGIVSGGSCPSFFDGVDAGHDMLGLVFSATGASANVGIAGQPNTTTANILACMVMDLRVEYEFSTPAGSAGTPIVLCIGDSIT
jgi:hypothetical protein